MDGPRSGGDAVRPGLGWSLTVLAVGSPARSGGPAYRRGCRGRVLPTGQPLSQLAAFFRLGWTLGGSPGIFG